MLHILLHFLVPAVIAGCCFRNRWRNSYLIMIATMLVDLDHLLATPIYDAMRCSINYHPLHGFVPIAIYVLLCIPARTRILAIGLLIHMVLDSIDCQVTNNAWFYTAVG